MTTTHHHHPDSMSLAGRGAWLRLILLCTAQFLLILDISVANVALPSIGAELGLDRGLLTWVVTIYLLMFGNLMVLGGRVADVVGAKRAIIVGLAVFAAASFVAGLATDPVAWPAAPDRDSVRPSSPPGALAGGPPATAGRSAPALPRSGGCRGHRRGRRGADWRPPGRLALGWRWAFLVTGPAALILLVLLARLHPGALGPRCGAPGCRGRATDHDRDGAAHLRTHGHGRRGVDIPRSRR